MGKRVYCTIPRERAIKSSEPRLARETCQFPFFSQTSLHRSAAPFCPPTRGRQTQT